MLCNLVGLRMGLKSLSTCTPFSGNLSFTLAMLLSMELSLIPLKQFFVPDGSLVGQQLLQMLTRIFFYVFDCDTVATSIDCI